MTSGGKLGTKSLPLKHIKLAGKSIKSIFVQKKRILNRAKNSIFFAFFSFSFATVLRAVPIFEVQSRQFEK